MRALGSDNNPTKSILRKELLLLAGFLFLGVGVLPIAVYFVGQAIFGEYGGQGYGEFFGDLIGRIAAGQGAAWFLVLSPYLGWQMLRLIGFGWRATGRRAQS